MKSYELGLPVFKKGDDLGGRIDHFKDDAKALLSQAEAYEEAAKSCRRAASLVAEGQLTIEQADTHCIHVSGDPNRLAELEKEGLLFSIDYDDEEGDDELES